MLNIIMDYRMVPLLSALSLALCHEALEGGGYQQMGTIKIAKRNFPNAKHMGFSNWNLVMYWLATERCAKAHRSVMIFASL